MTCPSSTLLPSFRTNISWHQSQIQAIESCLMFCLNFHGSILYLQNSRWKQVCFIFTRCPQGRLSISCNFYVGGTKSWTGMTVSGSESLVKTSIPVAKFCLFQWFDIKTTVKHVKRQPHLVTFVKSWCQRQSAPKPPQNSQAKGAGPALEEILPLCPWFSKSFKLVVNMMHLTV